LFKTKEALPYAAPLSFFAPQCLIAEALLARSISSTLDTINPWSPKLPKPRSNRSFS
jgi:hypothetical protein